MTQQNHRWVEAHLSVPASLADDAAAALVEAGAGAVQIIGPDTLPPPDAELTPVPDGPPNAAGDSAQLIASFESGVERDETLAAMLFELSNVGITLKVESIEWRVMEGNDWSEKWKEFFEPLQLSPRYWVAPSWRHDFAAPEGSLLIRLDPGMAFGTGQHATTALCAAMLDAALQAPDARTAPLLDLGTGSGILAIAAALDGVPRIRATDIDPLSVEATLENARVNGVSSAIEVDGSPIHAITERFPRVIANILATILMEHAASILERLEPGGHLILSGILTTQEGEVIDAYAQAAARAAHLVNLEHRSTIRKGDWVAIDFDAT